VKLKVLKEELSKPPPVDLADVLEGLGHEQRLAIFDALDTEQASDKLEALDPKVQRDVIAALDREKVAQLVNEMTPGQAAKVQAILEKQEEKVVDYATSGFLRFDPDKLVARTRVEFREAARGKAELTYIYVIDRDDHLLGVVESKALLLADDAARLRDIMTTKIVTLTPQSTLRVASETFARYLFRALPVVDETGKILRVLPYRDVVALRHRYVE